MAAGSLLKPIRFARAQHHSNQTQLGDHGTHCLIKKLRPPGCCAERNRRETTEYFLSSKEDGSSNRNPPERCPRPLYSRDSTQEHQEIPQEVQVEDHIEVEVKEEPQDPYVMSDDWYKEEIIPQEISTDPGDTQRDVKAEEEEEEEEQHVRIKEEEVPIEICTDPRDTRRDVKPEEEEGHMRIKEEENPLEISTGFSNFVTSDTSSGHDQSASRLEDLEISYFNDGISSSSEESNLSFHIEESEEEPHSPSSVTSEDEDYSNLCKRLREKHLPEGCEEPPSFPVQAPKRRRLQEDDSLVGHTRWCICGKCMPMPTADECRCCCSLPEVQPFLRPGMKCVTEAAEFHERCLNRKILFYQIQCLPSISQKEYIKDSNRCYRRGAYKVYGYMIHGFLARNKRVAIPSCVVWTIRQKYPDPNADYLGFAWPFDYNASDMASE
ncbi:uncharacterized protein ACMZJ9_014379 [Mantella aurantiaca]